MGEKKDWRRMKYLNNRITTKSKIVVVFFNKITEKTSLDHTSNKNMLGSITKGDKINNVVSPELGSKMHLQNLHNKIKFGNFFFSVLFISALSLIHI